MLWKKYYEELKEWVSSKIYDIGENIDDGEINVEGLGNILKENQDTLDDSNDENKNESLNNLLGELKVIERKSAVFSGGMLYRKDGETTQSKACLGAFNWTLTSANEEMKTMQNKNKERYLLYISNSKFHFYHCLSRRLSCGCCWACWTFSWVAFSSCIAALSICSAFSLLIFSGSGCSFTKE